MSRAPGGGGVFKSASATVLRPKGKSDAPASTDPLAALLNRDWDKRKDEVDDHAPKKTGMASRRGLQTELSGALEKSKSQKGNLFVDTGQKGRLVGFDEEHSPPADSPASPDSGVPARRKQAAAAAPVRKYHNDVCPETLGSPRLRTPPLVRKGQVKLDFEHAGEEADAEHAQAEVERAGSKSQMDPEQLHFVERCHHFHGAVNQAGVRLNEMLTSIRKRFLEDAKFLEDPKQYDQITEIAFEIQTACYFVTKWHHELEPRKIQAATRPAKIEDMSAEDILAQCFYSVSRLEVVASGLGPILEKICYDAKTLRRGPNGEPLTPTSKNALTLAQKRGFKHIEEFYRMIGHLEHVLSITHHLANPPTSGLPAIRKAAVVFSAAMKFKRNLKKAQTRKMEGEEGGEKKDAASVVSGAFKSLGKAAGSASPKEPLSPKSPKAANKASPKQPLSPKSPKVA